MKYVVALVVLVTTAAGQEINLVKVTSGFSAPTGIENAGDGSGRLFLVEQNGLVQILKNGVLEAVPFLDIQPKTQGGGERGLLGLAFPPGFASKQRFYVNYTNLNGDTVVAQYRVSSDPDRADAASETILMTIAQPFANHNGGDLRFGPDGYFYIGTGDGGSGGDPLGNGQNRGVLLGKMLRVDVEGDPGYLRIPADNPFITDPSSRGEIWAFGLRNPWRFSFDRVTGDLWIGDVGQNDREEIDFQPAGSQGGQDYGWNVMEGLHCYSQPGCSMQGLTLPVHEYSQPRAVP
jgi:glucose/arabinose dehydrogenase